MIQINLWTLTTSFILNSNNAIIHYLPNSQLLLTPNLNLNNTIPTFSFAAGGTVKQQL